MPITPDGQRARLSALVLFASHSAPHFARFCLVPHAHPRRRDGPRRARDARRRRPPQRRGVGVLRRRRALAPPPAPPRTPDHHGRVGLPRDCDRRYGRAGRAVDGRGRALAPRNAVGADRADPRPASHDRAGRHPAGRCLPLHRPGPLVDRRKRRSPAPRRAAGSAADRRDGERVGRPARIRGESQSGRRPVGSARRRPADAPGARRPRRARSRSLRRSRSTAVPAGARRPMECHGFGRSDPPRG